MREPAEYADEIERDATLPVGPGERFFGYGVMGLPFRSGHILGLRRFPASSIGPGYRSVWHRAPSGRWTFYQDQPAELACTRYFGAAVEEIREGPIEIAWTGPRSFEVSAGGGELAWTLELASTPVTSALNRVASLLPDRAWHSPPILAAMSRAAGLALRAGRVRLTGLAPNGQRFVANPLHVWVARESSAPACKAPTSVRRARCRAGATVRLRDPSARRVRRGPRLLRLRRRACSPISSSMAFVAGADAIGLHSIAGVLDTGSTLRPAVRDGCFRRTAKAGPAPANTPLSSRAGA